MDESTIPNDYKELIKDYPKYMAAATAEMPLVLFLDALDQLSNNDNARNLSWLPSELPEHVRLIVSAIPNEFSTPEESQSILEKKIPKSNCIELKPMSLNEGSQLLDHWLKDVKRELQDFQSKEVLNKFAECGLPLYLKLAFEEARRWRSHTKETLGSNVPELIQNLFNRLSSSYDHDQLMVSRSLGYLVAAKNGLTEDEIIEVLSRDVDIYESFFNKSYHVPPDFLECVKKHLHENNPDNNAEKNKDENEDMIVEKRIRNLQKDSQQLREFLHSKSSSLSLPVIIWSRLYFDLKPYLIERSADGTSLYAFFHRQFREMAAREYLSRNDKQNIHSMLADYFMKERAHIEPKNAEMKRFHGMARARYWGLPKVNVQFIITAIVVNIKRLANVIGSVCYIKAC